MKEKNRVKKTFLALAVLTCVESMNNVHASEESFSMNSNIFFSGEAAFSQNLEESLCDQSLKDGENDVANTILQPTVECKDAGSWLNVVVAVILWLIPKRTS